MKSVLISIQPKWCELIASGKKKVDVRKTKPKLETPFKCYIYCTLPPKEELFTHGCLREYAHELIRLQDGQIVYDYGMRLCCDIENRPYSQDNFLCRKVIGEFVCDYMTGLKADNMIQAYYNNTKETCLTDEEIKRYANGKKLYYWHITDLVIYDEPKELSDFKSYNCSVKVENGYPMPTHEIKRPPQSWCYVERKEDEKNV